MSRIAASFLIVGAVLAMGAMFPHLSVAAEPTLQPAPRIEVREAVEGRDGSRILALLVALEALRPAARPDRPKL